MISVKFSFHHFNGHTKLEHHCIPGNWHTKITFFLLLVLSVAGLVECWCFFFPLFRESLSVNF